MDRRLLIALGSGAAFGLLVGWAAWAPSSYGSAEQCMAERSRGAVVRADVQAQVIYCRSLFPR